MTKYIGMAVAALMAMLTLSVFTASALAGTIPDTYLCYKISEYKAKVKGGLYDAGCKELVGKLEGEWELAELLFRPNPTGNPTLWCALMHSKEDGYFTTARCTEKNKATEENDHDWTEVIKEKEEGLIFEFSVETKFTASWGESKLNLSGEEIKCKKAVGNESETIGSKKLGKFLIYFKECTLLGGECHSEGDANENILVPTEWHLVPPLGRIVFLLKPTKIICSLATLKVMEGSSVVGKIGEWGKKGTTFEVEVNAPLNSKEEHEQEYTEYENNAGKIVTAELKVEVGGKEHKTTQNDEKATITTEKETELVS